MRSSTRPAPGAGILIGRSSARASENCRQRATANRATGPSHGVGNYRAAHTGRQGECRSVPRASDGPPVQRESRRLEHRTQARRNSGPDATPAQDDADVEVEADEDVEADQEEDDQPLDRRRSQHPAQADRPQDRCRDRAAARSHRECRATESRCARPQPPNALGPASSPARPSPVATDASRGSEFSRVPHRQPCILPVAGQQ